MRLVLTENHATRLVSCVVLLAGYACAIQAQQTTDVAAPGSAEMLGPSVLPNPPVTIPKPPQISCQGDQLAIMADNSTMGSVLAGIHACTGVEIQMPAGVAEERTYIKLGPGPTREVLNDLLSSTELNYLIESSNTDPRKILTILLTARTKDADNGKEGNGAMLTENLTMTPARRVWLASRNAARSAPTPTEDQEAAAPANEEPGTSSTPENLTPSQTNLRSAVVGTDAAEPGDLPQGNDRADQTAAAPHTPEVTASSDTPSPGTAIPGPASPDSSDEQSPAKELRSKINQMQQLFEERKKMNTNPSATPNPN